MLDRELIWATNGEVTVRVPRSSLAHKVGWEETEEPEQPAPRTRYGQQLEEQKSLEENPPAKGADKATHVAYATASARGDAALDEDEANELTIGQIRETFDLPT